MRRGDPSPTARRAGGQFVLGAEVNVFALTRSVRYICAGRGKRDGRPVPYGPQGGRPMRAWCGGNRFCPDPLGSLRCAGRGEKGRETRPLRGCSIMRHCIDRIRRGGVSPPVRGAYLANGTLPSGEGGNDTHGTLHEKSVGTADPSGEGGNDTQGTLHALVARPAGRDGRPVPYGFHWDNVTNRAG